MQIRLLAAVALLAVSMLAHAGNYDIDRNQDGPFAFTISGVKLNEGSTLSRESILFNDPICPVSLRSHSTKIVYKDRGFRFAGLTDIDVKRQIVAVQVRTILYDVFGKHMKNLANTDPKDFPPGTAKMDGEWRASENDVAELLTTVTYVARVRLADGSQWIFNEDNLHLALKGLNLEQKIGEKQEE